MQFRRYLQRQLERAPALALRLRAVRVCADHRELALPDRGPAAATVRSPIVPAPTTTTTSDFDAPPRNAACTQHANGSIKAAASSVSAAGTACTCDGWATSTSPHPPPVLAQ